ncbi:MAG: valine--tRNA ligase, partial [Actinomycetota bacterium]|nr:valine--tRNA ligase [Actinomycetota bacterium]
MTLPKAYQPEEIERRWYERWESDGVFGADARSPKQPYSIVLPPPNVTGALHIGHALNHSLQDALVRRARMLGREALWVPGTDHAGIATQNVVERELLKEGVDRHDLGREAFVEKVWEWKHRYGSRITQQMRQLGESCDWERERFTMDEGLSRAVRTVFVRWYEDGLIYRGLRVINWCPRCTTALSDIEVEHEDVAGELVTFRYELTDGSGSISVATTRIETMLGDTGIFVHPDDERYAALVGKTVKHPFFPERVLPIVADAAVDPDFGTGAVKGTPAHDPNDFEMGERAGLDKVNIFDETAHVNENGGRFAGLDRHEARGAVFRELDALGLVEEVERPYVHAVGHCYRCGTEIEPWLSEQWFVKMKPLAEPAIEAAKDGRVRFHPPRFAKAYLNWMENLRDWCISRQLWWGHRIPVWYCDECDRTVVALEDPETCECGSAALTQDPDVLDTWFSSQLWPFSTLGWPGETTDLKTFYPTTVMVTAYEIIY